MNGQETPDGQEAAKLYKALRDRLRASPEGKRVIAAFEADPDPAGEAGAALADFLADHLDRDARQQIASALGERSQFATVVTGGHVDQIINIASAGAVTITKQFFVFRTAGQVLLVLGFLALVGIVIRLGIWWSSRPAVMDGDFNIAVAEFAEIPETDNPTVAPIASRMVFDFLDAEYQLGEFGGQVQVTHKNIGVITGGAEAEKIAEATNADLVIYGDVSVVGGSALISPRFYVREDFSMDTGDLTGQHQLALPIEFETGELLDYDSEVNQHLRQRNALLIDFTTALAFLAADNYEAARAAIEEAIAIAEEYGSFEGQEVLYLFGSTIARSEGDYEASQAYVNQALELNPNYGRAFIAQAAIHYEQLDFDTALDYYERALELEDQPYGSFIEEKAHLGIGHIYNYQYQEAEPDQRPELKEKMLAEYQTVLDAYEETSDRRIREHAAWAHYASGVIFQIEGDAGLAADEYSQALELTSDSDLTARAEERLAQVSEPAP